MVIGIVCAVLAGMLISLQTVLNARMSDAFGAWATTTLVFFVGFIGASIPYVLFRGVVFCVMRGIQLLGPSVAISVVLISQLSFALAVDTFGWFGLPQIDLSFGQLVGLAVMVCGIFVLKRYQVVAPEEKAKDMPKQVS